VFSKSFRVIGKEGTFIFSWSGYYGTGTELGLPSQSATKFV
jgi:hypothetical protein